MMKLIPIALMSTGLLCTTAASLAATKPSTDSITCPAEQVTQVQEPGGPVSVYKGYYLKNGVQIDYTLYSDVPGITAFNKAGTYLVSPGPECYYGAGIFWAIGVINNPEVKATTALNSLAH